MVPTLLMFALASGLPVPPTTSEGVVSPEGACRLVTAMVRERHEVPENVSISCDHLTARPPDDDLYVFALRSDRTCDYICSNLMGWFAVRRATGQIYEWDIGEWQVGRPLGAAW